MASPGFIFGGDTGVSSAAELARKREIVNALLETGDIMPRTFGEGLTVFGRAIAGRLQDKKLGKQEDAERARAKAVFESVNGGNAYASSRGYSPSGTWTPEAPAPKATEAFLGMPDVAKGGTSYGLPKADTGVVQGGLDFGAAVMTPQEMLIAGATARGLNPIDVATAISYETGGRFDPVIKGPTTQWGTHEGLIQFGDPQGKEHGAVFDQGTDAAWRSQLNPENGAVWSYLDSVGVKPGMGLPEIYSGINAGAVGRMNASDANNGGAPGTVADKVASMGPHREKAAQFLGGTWTPTGGDAVTMSAKGEATTGVGPDMGRIAQLSELASNPYLPEGQRAVVSALMEAEMQKMQPVDPMDAIELRKAELELAQMENPSQEPIKVGDVLLDPVTMQPIYDGRETKEAPRPMTPQERSAWGIPETDTTPYKMTDAGPVAIGGGNTIIDMGGGGKFEEAFAKGDAATIETVYNSGLAAQRNLGRIDQLEAALAASPTGMEGAFKQQLGELGVATEGLDAIQSAQALVNSLVPEQRQPGSGPMSDADLALFKQSLPRIINQPGGNKIIVDTMRAIAQYDAEGAAIVQRMRSGELNRAQAFDALQNRPNPLAKVAGAGVTDTSASPADDGIPTFNAQTGEWE